MKLCTTREQLWATCRDSVAHHPVFRTNPFEYVKRIAFWPVSSIRGPEHMRNPCVRWDRSWCSHASALAAPLSAAGKNP